MNRTNKEVTQALHEEKATLLSIQIQIADKQNRSRCYYGALQVLLDEIQSLQNAEIVAIEEMVVLERQLARQLAVGIKFN